MLMSSSQHTPHQKETAEESTIPDASGGGGVGGQTVLHVEATYIDLSLVVGDQDLVGKGRSLSALRESDSV